MEIFEKARQIGTEVVDGRVIYKGLVFDITTGDLQIMHSRRDFYEPIDECERDVFDDDGFEAGVSNHLHIKYRDQLDRVNGFLQSEIAYRRNQKRIAYLKTVRDNLIEKINNERT